MNMEEKQHKSEGINPSPAIVIITLVSIIAAVLTALYVFLYNPPVYTILFIGILLGGGGVILILISEIHRQKKKLEKTDKSRKILEIKQKGIEELPTFVKILFP
jgi:hypothetical protein